MTKRRLRAWALVALGCQGTSVPGCGSTDERTPPVTPPGALAIAFEQVPFPTSLSYITDLAFSPGGSGKFMAIDLYGGYELAELSSSGAVVLAHGTVPGVFAEYDAGLLALALDPEFENNRYFYLSMTLAKNHVVVRRYTLDEDSEAGTLASAVDILEIKVPSSPRWHNISAMGFDESGIMWVLAGDKGNSLPTKAPYESDAQDPASQLGKLLRLVPSKEAGVGGFTVPEAVVPYSPSAALGVANIGIRSPWKGLYHEGAWYYGDVGLDDVEEVNKISMPGQNLGWPVVEGRCADDVHGNKPDCTKYLDPWVYYGRSSSHPFVLDDLQARATNKRSVYAGWIYRPQDGDPYDGRWNDVIVFGDAFVGFMRAARLNTPTESWHLAHLGFPSGWGQGPDGYVYVTALSEEPDAREPDQVSGLPSPLLRIVPR